MRRDRSEAGAAESSRTPPVRKFRPTADTSSSCVDMKMAFSPTPAGPSHTATSFVRTMLSRIITACTPVKRPMAFIILPDSFTVLPIRQG